MLVTSFNIDLVLELYSRLIRKNKTLTKLTINNGGIDNEGITTILGPALSKNTTLKTLDISGNHIGYNGIIALKEALDKRLGLVFLKYKGQSFPMDYKTGSKFERFVKDLEKSGYFSDDDEVSDFMSSNEFERYADKFNVSLEEPGYSPEKLKLAPEKPSSTLDSKPRQAKDMSARPGAAPGATSLTDFDLQELLKKGKVKTSVLKEIIKREYKK